MDILFEFLKTTGFWSMTFGNFVMIVIGIVFIALAIIKDYEPLLLVPIGMGAIVGNIPVIEGMALSVYHEHKWLIEDGEIVYQPGSVLSYLYFGVSQGIYPPLIFLGIGAMTDFSTMLSNPKLVLLGAAAQVGVFLTFLGAAVVGLLHEGSGRDRDHRRRRRADRDLPFGEACAPSVGRDRDCRLFIHGARARHSAADHEAVDDPAKNG